MTSSVQVAPAWILSAAKWLTPRRVRAQAIVLALALWGVCAVDFATPDLLDRAGNIKFQDFLQFHISARLIREGRSAQLFDQPVADEEMRVLVGEHVRLHLPTVYGPQVGLLYVPLARLSFPAAARIWAAVSLLASGACLYLIWRSCAALRLHAGTVAICAVAFPPLFHFFVRGQISALLLICFSAAFLAFRRDRDWLAGIALGFLIFKPQFLVAIPLILLLAHAWKAFAGLAASACAQLALTRIYFGPAVMRSYFDTMLHMSRWIGLSEVGPAHIQMHSLRSFWTLLIPWPEVALVLFVLTSIAVIAMAAAVWKSPAALAVRFSALILAGVLVNPHLFVYDLLVLAPVFLLLGDWILANAQPAFAPTLHVLLYLAYLLPLFGPLSRWTHVQLSVLAFAALLWVLWRYSRISSHNLPQTNPALYKPSSRRDPMRTHKAAFILLMVASCALISPAQSKPNLTLDEFFNSVSFPALEISPDGNSVVIETERADWDQQIFRKDLWLYHDGGKAGVLIQLTQSGHDSEPKWSPDGRWIAFLSERKVSAEKDDDSDSDSESKGEPAQVYLIAPDGGEAFPVTLGEEEVHTFSWSADSQMIYFATRQPWSKTQKDDYKKDWKDVVQYRTAERGDTIFTLNLSAALARHAAAPAKMEKKDKDSEKEPDLTPGARVIATTPLRVESLVTSPDGSKLAFISNAINQRQEKYEDVEIYTVDLSVARALSPATTGSVPEAAAVQPRRITKNEAAELRPYWANDSRHIFFSVEVGDVAGPYRDLQPHLYWVDSDTGQIEQWAKDFIGPVEHYAVVGADAFLRSASAASGPRTNASGASVLTSARIGTEVQMYSVDKPSETLHRLSEWPGTYANISAAANSKRVAFVYSSLSKPEEIYLADNAEKLDQAHAVTSFNQLFTQRDLPQGKPYQWKADDGTTVEGMLIYPPGKFGAKHLPMFTLIHGGPADADGNHFEADWYQWAALAASNGWLVFEPNYRGSTGYGDKFLRQIVPTIVSRPGKDILEGVDALVKDGIADPDHLTIGGYSYGGYMTNWLITQTARFKAAVTGAGAVEHIGNWGNDDTTYDDAYFLGGRPWEAAQRYHDEAAIFQIDKVRTPTHMVAGADDIRVAVMEDYLLEHALYSLGIPNSLLVFPGEGHSLSKNPWHGKIKVREELKWLEKYGGVPAGK